MHSERMTYVVRQTLLLPKVVDKTSLTSTLVTNAFAARRRVATGLAIIPTLSDLSPNRTGAVVTAKSVGTDRFAHVVVLAGLAGKAGGVVVIGRVKFGDLALLPVLGDLGSVILSASEVLATACVGGIDQSRKETHGKSNDLHGLCSTY